ncbi:MAG: undecaprenyl-diphosphate phosphatase [Ruminococcaceae bacterium]|nr:undecaprenyl-diphosphate phosphatase [Oscillospiraceae bacterium]
MTIWEAIILGLVQGLTEFLPVSSSGHLTLLQAAFGIEENSMLFSILLHFGTLISVFICFWRDIVEMVREFFLLLRDACRGEWNLHKTPMRRQMVMVVLATIPMVVAVFINDYIESFFTSTLLVGFMLLITAALLVVTDMHGFGRKDASTATWRDALIIGAMQLVAIIPGISRSGTVMTGGALRGYSRPFAVKFAFIMSIPVIIGANIFSVVDAVKESIDPALILPCLVGVFVAMLSGIAAIKLMNMLVRRKSFRPFVLYCTLMGLISIVLSLIF